jgi:Na+/H+ antiporter NhaD/arsenite permease-like protein
MSVTDPVGTPRSGEAATPAPDPGIDAARRGSRGVVVAILAVLALYVLALPWLDRLGGPEPGPAAAAAGGPAGSAPPAAAGPAGDHERPAAGHAPPVWAATPFVLLLLGIALLPLIPRAAHWWEKNANRFLVAAALAVATLSFYGLAHPGGLTNHLTHAVGSARGFDTVATVFANAIPGEFVPFIVLLFGLYVITGGINLSGDLPARPLTNCAFLAAGTVLASFIGTTGAAMLLIRPLLSTNAERWHRAHTVVFFIFMVCNCGGLLLPIGDPPLFLGYLRGVPFLWTMRLLPYWLGVNLSLLLVYYLWDDRAYRQESARDITRDETGARPLRIRGAANLLYLLGVVLCVAVVVPGAPLLGSEVVAPPYLREALILALVVASLATTAPEIRSLNRFNYGAILEVAALFFGIFICMQVPIEILNHRGPGLGIDTSLEFFWSTGALSSFLDNAPTYVVFFETARTLSGIPGGVLVPLGAGDAIWEGFLRAISLGAVLMGAMTYIGNGPNFMVRSIAEQAGVRMPSFFGYMAYSGIVLLPLFVALSFWL